MREVIVCDLGSTDQTHYVAEHAGCHFMAEGGIAAGIARAKGDWLLILEPGARLLDGWIEPVVMHMRASRRCRPVSRGPATSGCRSWRGCSRPTARSPKGW